MANKLKLLNYVLAAMIIEEDEDGNVIRKIPMDPQEVFGRGSLINQLDKIDEFIEQGIPSPPVHGL